MALDGKVGIIGGTGMLGAAIATGLLESGALREDQLWLANRSGSRAGWEARRGVTVTADVAALVAACDTVVLSLPPALYAGMDIAAAGKLVISVMAGVPVTRLAAQSGGARIIRAMSSPAAAERMAYSPFLPGPGATREDAAQAAALFGAVGLSDEVDDEDLIDVFTAITGPVPGFVALFAESMAAYARAKGAPAGVADRAVRQLFRAASEMMAEGPTPAVRVQDMVDYAGTTAAGLTRMQEGPLLREVAAGLEAARRKAREMGKG